MWWLREWPRTLHTALYNIFSKEPLVQCAFSLIKFWLIWLRPWEVAYESLKTKEKSILVIPELVAVAYGSFSLQSLSFEFKQGFTKVVVTIAGRLREWSQGKLFSRHNTRVSLALLSLRKNGGLLVV